MSIQIKHGTMKTEKMHSNKLAKAKKRAATRYKDTLPVASHLFFKTNYCYATGT